MGFASDVSDASLIGMARSGDLDAPDAARLERHLGTCAICREALRALRATVGLLRSLPRAVPGRSFTLERRPEVAADPPRYLWGLRAATVAASVGLVLLVAGDLLGAFARDVPQAGDVSDVAVEQVRAAGEMGFADAESQPMAAAESAALQDTGAPAAHSEPRQTGVAESAVSPDESQVAGETHETQRKEAFPVIALEIALGALLAALASLTCIILPAVQAGRTGPVEAWNFLRAITDLMIETALNS